MFFAKRVLIVQTIKHSLHYMRTPLPPGLSHMMQRHLCSSSKLLEFNIISFMSLEGSTSASGENSTYSATAENNTVIVSIICGALPFCEQSANRRCHITPVKSCDQCSLARGGAFVFFFVLLALSIVIGNLLIVCVGWLRYRKKVLNKTDISKTSLALGDMLIGNDIVIL